MPDFPHGLRVYHRTRREYGAIVVHDKLWEDASSVHVQFDGKTDIEEVSKALLDVDSGPTRYAPGQKVRIVRNAGLGEYEGKVAIIIRAGVQFSLGRAYLVRFTGGEERTINETHFEKEASDA